MGESQPSETPKVVTEYLAHWASQPDDRIALTAGDTELTYGDLFSYVSRVASGLDAVGVGNGDRVVIAGVNTPAWVISLLAVLTVGAIAVPLNSRLGADQIETFLDRIEPSLVFADESQRATFAGVRDRLGERLLSLGDGDPEALALESKTGWKRPRIDPAQPALINFTSGTTALPKGAVISHRALIASASAWLPFLQSGRQTRTTVLVPLFHNTGHVDQLTHMLILGGAVDLVKRYRTDVAIDAMVRRPPTFFGSVPSVLRLVMLHPRAHEILSRCEIAAVGGSAMPQDWILEAQERWPNLKILHGYGLTEFTALSHVLPAEESLTNGDSVGWPIGEVRCTIRDEHGSEVHVDEVGEVWLAGPQRMDGYWRAEAATQSVFVDEWLRTGDLGRLDERGLLWLEGRVDDVINRGGEKVLPRAVESALSRIAGVAEAAVFGVPHDLLGSQVAAAVVLRSGESLTEEYLVRELARMLPNYAVPEHVFFIEEMPLAATGKPDKKVLREHCNDAR